ncbi:MAG: phosphate ABC transporter substrate-binding protein PstS [Brevinema sp.]
MKNILLFSVTLFVSSCSSKEVMMLQGAGATFPAPIYNQLFADYTKQSGVAVTYQGIGSGGGIQNISSGIVDFGATDAFLSDREITEQESELLHIPAVLAAVNFTYNIPGRDDRSVPLALDADLIAKIYAGEITSWNDPQIQALNPQENLPALEIIPVYRSDSSGTTFVMSEFLTKASTKWSNTFGTGKTINWIAGIGQKGNSAVMAFAKENQGSIAYVDLVYARQNNFPVAKIKNRFGNFVTGDITNASVAAASVNIPTDTRISLTDTAGAEAAPMATFSYLLVRKEQNYNNRSLQQAQELVKLLQWMYTSEAQSQHEQLYFSPMPANVLELGANIINQITYDGNSVIDTL